MRRVRSWTLFLRLASCCCLENQKVIHLVGLYEIIFSSELISGLAGFADYHITHNAVVFTVAVAVDHADFRSFAQCWTQVTEQGNRLFDLVVGFEQKDRVDTLGGQKRIVRTAEDRVYVP